MSGGPELPEDPGWGHALREAPLALVPIVRRWRRDRWEPDTSVLAGLRVAFATTWFGLACVAVVGVLSIDGDPDYDPVQPTTTATAVAVIGLISVFAITVARRRELVCGSDDELAQTFRTQTFNGILISVVPALAGYSGAIVSASMVPYAVGAGFAASGLLVVAPTSSALRRAQRSLDAAGCGRSLAAALAAPLSSGKTNPDDGRN